ncbi:MAG TPA: hypothetical protein VHF88_00125, partial [Thermoleophilaceae bacterium]|nr:hypothetical protein [Thermoleophilaceae bacterium]
DLVGEGVPADLAGACARLALGNASRARFLASEEGAALRADVDRLVAAALAGGTRHANEPEPWRGLGGEPKGRDRSAIEKQFDDAAKRDGRRARTELLDLGLTLAALRFRDLVCLAEGADDAVLDRAGAATLATAAPQVASSDLRAAAERCEDVRMSLELNVTEDLALEALGFRLARLVGAPA